MRRLMAWDPNALARMPDRARHVPVHRVANVLAVAEGRAEPVTVCGWRPPVRGVLLTAGAARQMEGLFCRGCWRVR